MELSKNVALISCATQGAGPVLAEVLAAEGARVYLQDIDRNSLHDLKDRLATRGYSVEAVNSNPNIISQVRQAIQRISDREGHLDLLVNNTTGPSQSAQATEDDPYLPALTNDIRGVFNFSRAVADQMKRQRGGAIINILYSATASNPLFSLTRALASTLSPYNVWVSALSARTNQAFGQDEPGSGKSPPMASREVVVQTVLLMLSVRPYSWVSGGKGRSSEKEPRRSLLPESRPDRLSLLLPNVSGG
ncbi:MAG: SDR family NAD(P)-dependent oxidoreductase [Firmicutes bacterium]|nr:SDR family NAD(P)-dependent oxidoreductase [Bacillota bacterium]